MNIRTSRWAREGAAQAGRQGRQGGREEEKTPTIADLFLCLCEYRYSPYVRPPLLAFLV
jgi:hypothetical protein